MLSVILTKHAKQRLRERVGLKIRSLENHIHKVIMKSSDIFVSMDQSQTLFVIFQEMKYIFKRKLNNDLVLVTVYKSDDDLIINRSVKAF
ncbi:MAG: hypothetical protein U9N59_16750 [Campylobacterota bacterium]|nr:hypothetical protein [Campylobacterota bacterium]